MRRWKKSRIAVAAAVAVLMLSACSGSASTEDGQADAGAGEESGAGDGGDPSDGENGGASGDAGANADLAGTSVEVFGAIAGQDAENFEASFAPFEERTGIDVSYEGSADFESLITVRVDGGDAPDVALFPQPGLMADFASGGDLVPLDGTDLDVAVNENYIDSWRDLGSVDGSLYGVWYRAVVKSLVWYPVAAFEAADYEIPETWDEMLELSRTIAADGTPPWCLGYESAGATGWAGTDWLEEVMLRMHGPDVYDQWTNHEIPFDDERVLEALRAYEEILLDEELVLGGTTAVLTTPFGDAMNPMLGARPAAEGEQPDCFLHRNGSFMPNFLPEDVTYGPDGDINVFYLPPMNEEYPDPVLGGGDVAGMFNDRPEVRAFVEFLASPESGEIWAGQGGYLSPHKSFDTSTYIDDFTRGIGDILATTSTFRYDASDLMPGSVGAGSFWTAMVDHANGTAAEQVLVTVEASWPDE